MHRSPTSEFERRRSVSTNGPAAQHMVLRAARRKSGEPGVDASHRPVVSEMAILRQPQDIERIERQPQAYPAADANHGDRGDLSQTSHDSSRKGTQDLSLFAARCSDNSLQSGLEHRHHLLADAAWLLVPDSRDGLVQSLRAVLAALQHAGGKFLFGSFGGSLARRATGDIQHRSGEPVHGRGVHLAVVGLRHRRQHGRAWPGVGQRVHRAALAKCEVRRGLSERLHQRARGGSITVALLSFLLPPANSSIVGLPNAGRDISRKSLKVTGGFARKNFKVARKNWKIQPHRKRGCTSASVRDLGGSRGPHSPTNHTLIKPVCCPNNGVHLKWHLR